MTKPMDRRHFVACFSSLVLGASLMPGALAAVSKDAPEVTLGMIEAAEKGARLTTNGDVTLYGSKVGREGTSETFIYGDIRPGMEGVGKIDIERRKLIWIWSHKIIHWFRMFFWTWWP